MCRKIVVSILVLAMCVMSVTVQAFAQPPDNETTPSAEKLLDLVNEFRAQEGTGVLSLSETLCQAANERAAEMAREGAISHVRPDGTIFDTTFEVSGDKGENVFRGGPLQVQEVPEKAFLAWRDKSISHRQNMMDSAWGYMGAGYAPGDDGYWYVCQLFCQTRPVTDVASESSTPPATDPGNTEPDAAPSQAVSPAPAAPTYDPSKILQWIEGPDEVTAGASISFKVVTAPSVNLWSYQCTWIHPGRYKSDVSRDLKTMTLRTKTEDTITVQFQIRKGSYTETVSKTVKVHNAVHAEITGPDQVMPGRRATVQLDTIAGVGPQDISWSVIPGLCALDFSADKRTCTFVSPSDANVLFIAKVKLKDSVATAKKTVKVVSEVPVELKAVTKGQVGYELEVHAELDPLIRPGHIYWSMYPGTCDAWFAPDNRTMYFTPTTTDTLEITVRAEYEGKSGAAFLVVPVAAANTSAGDPVTGATSAPTSTAPVTGATSAPTSTAPLPILPTSAPTSTAPLPILPTSAPTSTAPLPILPPSASTAAPLLPILGTQAPEPSATTDPVEGSALLPLLPEDPVTPTQSTPAEPISTPSAPTVAPSPTTTASADGPQNPLSEESVPTASAPASSVSGEETVPALQVAPDAKVSLQQAADGAEQVAVVQLKDQLTVGDILESVVASDVHEVTVINESGETVPADAIPATGQIVEVRDDSGRIVETVPIIVPGDVLGTGKMGIGQLVRAASAFVGEEPLTGVYLKAIKMTGPNAEGDINLADIVRMVQLLFSNE